METISALPEQTFKWYAVMREVFFHPSAQTFERILADPAASPRRACIWAAVMWLLVSTLGAILNPSPSSTAITNVILSPIYGATGLAMGAWLLHMSAKRYTGQGTFSRVFYAMGAIMISPYFLVFMILRWVLASQELWSSLVLVLFSLFLLYLIAQAIKAAEKISTRQAFWTLILPVLLVVVVVVLIIVALAFINPALRARVDRPLPTASKPAAAIPTLEPGWQLYQVGADGFALAFPPGWVTLDVHPQTLEANLKTLTTKYPDFQEGQIQTIRSAPENDIKFMAFDMSPEATANGYSTFCFVSLKALPEEISLDALSEGIANQLEIQDGTEKPVDHHRITLRSGEAEEIYYKSIQTSSAETQVSVTGYMLISLKGKSGYYLYCMSSIDQAARVDPLFPKIGQSFQVTQ